MLEDGRGGGELIPIASMGILLVYFVGSITLYGVVGLLCRAYSLMVSILWNTNPVVN